MQPTIRLAELSDAKAIQEIYAPIVINTATSFEMVPPTEVEVRNRISAVLTKFPWLVCEIQNDVLGYAYASTHRDRTAYRWSVDVSVYVHQRARRTGVGRALYSSLFPILVQQGLYNAFAGITLPNAGSVGLHESLGFRPIAVYRNVGHKHGRWHDVGWWQFGLQELVDSPESPKTIHQIQDSPGFESAVAQG